MRKILLFIFLLISFQNFFSKNVYAGPQCSALSVGAQCAVICVGTQDKGQMDCSIGLRCCIPNVAIAPAAAAGAGPCAGIKDATEFNKCEKCTGTTHGNPPLPIPAPLSYMDGKTGVWTALGCVHTTPELFVGQLLTWVMGIGGGLAFLLIVFGGFKVLTSGGDPEHLNDGKEIIVSALTGLLLIIFSVILLRIIGVDILQIPGFSTP